MSNRYSRLATALVWIGACCAANAADLIVTVKGLSSDKGPVLAALYNNAGDWLKTPLQVAETASSKGAASLTFKNLAPGEYAVSLFQDENSNGDLDTNLVGIPKEPYGFSNDAMGTFGPPSFERAKFKVGPENLAISIQLR